MFNRFFCILAFLNLFPFWSIILANPHNTKFLGHPKIWNVPPQSEYHLGRGNSVKKIKAALERKRTLHIVTLVGMTGIGKTQLAKEYAYTYAGSYNLIWWMDANQELLPQIRELGQILNSRKACNMPNMRERTQEKWLEAILNCYKQHFPKVLFIVDDVKEKESINLMTQALKGAHILFTSRNQSLGADNMQLKCFTREESLNYLKKRLSEASQDSLNELTEALNDYPLALAQAATYMGLVPSLSVEEYINLYIPIVNECWV